MTGHDSHADTVAAEQRAAKAEQELAVVQNLAMEHMHCSGCPTPWWLKQALGPNSATGGKGTSHDSSPAEDAATGSDAAQPAPDQRQDAVDDGAPDTTLTEQDMNALAYALVDRGADETAEHLRPFVQTIVDEHVERILAGRVAARDDQLDRVRTERDNAIAAWRAAVDRCSAAWQVYEQMQFDPSANHFDKAVWMRHLAALRAALGEQP